MISPSGQIDDETSPRWSASTQRRSQSIGRASASARARRARFSGVLMVPVAW